MREEAQKAPAWQAASP